MDTTVNVLQVEQDYCVSVNSNRVEMDFTSGTYKIHGLLNAVEDSMGFVYSGFMFPLLCTH